MERWPDGSPEDAYGRVTAPERFAPLLASARALLDRLEREHVVEREEGLDLDPGLVERVDAASLVRLRPVDAGAAPLTVVVTRFPGLIVRAGRWRTQGFPACGCDACDEQPEALTTDLLAMTAAVVAGRLTEELTRGRHPVLRHAVSGEGWASSGEESVEPARARLLGPPQRLDWRPWARRPSAPAERAGRAMGRPRCG